MRMRRLACIALCAALMGTAGGADLFRVQKRLYKVGPVPCAIAARDLNDDGLPEIVTCDRGQLRGPREEKPANDEISLLIAQADGSYIKRTPSLRTGFAPYAVALVNIDALKWPDIVTVSFHAAGTPNIHLFLNLRSEDLFKPMPFSLPDERLTYTYELPADLLPYLRHEDGDQQPLFAKPGLTSLAVADLDGDGLRDLVTTAWASDVVAVVPGHAEKHFDVDATRFYPVTGAPRDVALADLDRDGALDAAVACYTAGRVVLLRGDGEGGFAEAGSFGTRGSLPVRIRAADMNGDGALDLALAHRDASDLISLFYGANDFRFGTSQVLFLGKDPEVLEEDVRDLVAEDLDGDGRVDLAAACVGSGDVVVLRNASAPETFRLQFDRERHAFPEGRAAALAAADLDGDGDKDLAVALWDADAVGLLLNRGEP